MREAHIDFFWQSEHTLKSKNFEYLHQQFSLVQALVYSRSAATFLVKLKAGLEISSSNLIEACFFNIENWFAPARGTTKFAWSHILIYWPFWHSKYGQLNYHIAYWYQSWT